MTSDVLSKTNDQILSLIDKGTYDEESHYMCAAYTVVIVTAEEIVRDT